MDRIIRRYRMKKAMLRSAVSSVALSLALLGCGSSSDSRERTGPGSAKAQSSASASASADGEARCGFASVRPAYLPWLKRGEEVPPPQKYHGPDEAAWLDWRRPDWAEDAPYYVVLRRDSQFSTSSGQLVPGTRLPETAEPGRLHSGEVGFSPSVVWFLDGATSCEWLTLQLSAPGMSREQAEEEIVRVARSLEPHAAKDDESDQHVASPECPPDWPGPWTACPGADWVQQVAERAGYRITGETGSALIARGNGWRFYIWATPAGTPEEVRKAAKDEWPTLGTVEGVEVYGDENVWRWWLSEGLTLWLQAGPTEDSRLPPLEEMDSLVRASKTAPPPH